MTDKPPKKILPLDEQKRREKAPEKKPERKPNEFFGKPKLGITIGFIKPPRIIPWTEIEREAVAQAEKDYRKLMDGSCREPGMSEYESVKFQLTIEKLLEYRIYDKAMILCFVAIERDIDREYTPGEIGFRKWRQRIERRWLKGRRKAAAKAAMAQREAEERAKMPTIQDKWETESEDDVIVIRDGKEINMSRQEDE